MTRREKIRANLIEHASASMFAPCVLAAGQQVTFLYVRDLAASEQFYRDALGLELVLNQGLARIDRIGRGNAFLGICLSSAVQQALSPDRSASSSRESRRASR